MYHIGNPLPLMHIRQRYYVLSGQRFLCRTVLASYRKKYLDSRAMNAPESRWSIAYLDNIRINVSIYCIYKISIIEDATQKPLGLLAFSIWGHSLPPNRAKNFFKPALHETVGILPLPSCTGLALSVVTVSFANILYSLSSYEKNEKPRPGFIPGAGRSEGCCC